MAERRPREELLPVDGPAAPPRANGELVFEAPWQARMFGVTVALYEQGRFAWPEFQQRLIAAVARWEAGRREGDPQPYWECWLDALEALLVERGLCMEADVAALAERLAARPADHDH